MLNKPILKYLSTTALCTLCFNVFGAELVIEISDVAVDRGSIGIQIFSSKEQYENEESHEDVRVEAVSPLTTVKVDLQEGEYSFRLFHDADGDGEMKYNFIGLPQEPYAFSNNRTPGMGGSPPWDRVKFTVGADGAKQEIKLKGKRPKPE